MLVIRQQQRFALASEELDTYLQRVISDVLRCWPRLGRGSEDALHHRIRRHANAAASVGLRTHGEWLRYLNVAIALGDDFADRPEARRILGSRRPAGLRLNELVRWAETTLRAS